MEFLQKECQVEVEENCLCTNQQGKINITHMASSKAYFLGVEILRSRKKCYTTQYLVKNKGLIKTMNRKVNNKIMMYAPIDRIVQKLIMQKYLCVNKRPRSITK
jgi:flavorubredoxin